MADALSTFTHFHSLTAYQWGHWRLEVLGRCTGRQHRQVDCTLSPFFQGMPMQPILGCLTSLQTLTAHEQTAKIAANLNDNANCSLVCGPPPKVPVECDYIALCSDVLMTIAVLVCKTITFKHSKTVTYPFLVSHLCKSRLARCLQMLTYSTVVCQFPLTFWLVELLINCRVWSGSRRVCGWFSLMACGRLRSSWTSLADKSARQQATKRGEARERDLTFPPATKCPLH